MNGTLITKEGIELMDFDDHDLYELVDAKMFFTNIILIKDVNFKLIYNHYGNGFVSVNSEDRRFNVQGNCMIIQTNIAGKLEDMTQETYQLLVNSGKYQSNGAFTLTNFIVDDNYERKVAQYLAKLGKNK